MSEIHVHVDDAVLIGDDFQALDGDHGVVFDTDLLGQHRACTQLQTDCNRSRAANSDLLKASLAYISK